MFGGEIVAHSNKNKMTAQEKKWQAEGDLRTLREAKDIQGSPTRIRAAKVMAKKEIVALKAISKRKK